MIETLKYETMKIGDGLENPEDNTRSTFKTVSGFVESNIQNVESELLVMAKNIHYIKQCLNEMENLNKEKLIELTKEIGNNIIQLYDQLNNCINDQRSENLRLQLEITNWNKEKNSLRHEIKKLSQITKKLEEHLGVDPDPSFDKLVFEV